MSYLRSIKVKNAFLVLFSLLAVCYALSLSMIPRDNIVDRSYYLVYARDSIVILGRYISEGVIRLFLNEPLWLSINIFLNYIFSGDQKLVVQSIIFFSSFIVFFKLFKENPRYFLFFLLVVISPQIIKNHITHIRQGLAIAIFLIGWGGGVNKRFFWGFLACLVHSSFIFLLPILFLDIICKRVKISGEFKLLLAFIYPFLVLVLFELVSSDIGVRQLEKGTVETSGASGLAFVFWFGVFVLMSLAGRKFRHEHFVALSMLFFYLVLYFFNPFSGRILESFLIIIIFAGVSLKIQKRVIFLGCFALYSLMSLFPRIGMDYLGYSI